MKDQSKIIIELLSQLDNSNLPPTVKTLKALSLLPFAMEGLFEPQNGSQCESEEIKCIFERLQAERYILELSNLKLQSEVTQLKKELESCKTELETLKKKRSWKSIFKKGD